MLIEPPTDKLIGKIGNKYALVCLLTKRARQLCDKRPNLLEETAVKPISYAAAELYRDKVIAVEE